MNSDFNTRQKNSWAFDLYIIWHILRKLVFDFFGPQKVTETAKGVKKKNVSAARNDGKKWISEIVINH